MKYALLSLPMIAAATLAAARETPLDPAQLWPKQQHAAPAPSAGEPPWLTGALDEQLMAESAAEDPHAGIGDPHADHHDHCSDHEHEHEHEGDPHGSLLDAPDVAPLPRSTAANARSVAEVVAQRTSLNEGLVRVHAQVVKRTEGILGKTYLHLRDGSGSVAAGDHDLTATTSEAFELGETVEVEGRVTIDQDIGLGYRYAVLLAETRRVTP
jgi:hypothetical protein